MVNFINSSLQNINIRNTYLIKVALEHFAFGLTLSISIVWMLARGLALTDIAFITSLSLLFGLIIDFPTGMMSDKFGRKYMLVGANALGAGAFLLFAFSHDFWHFLLAAMLQAASFAFVSGSEEAFVYEIHPKHYRRTLSSINMVDEASTVVGLASAPLLISLFSIQFTFLAAAGVLVISAVVGSIFLKEPERRISESKHQKEHKKNLLDFVRRHAPFLILFTLLAIYYEGGRVFWQPQLIATGFQIEQLGLLFAIFKIASLVGAYVGRHQRFTPQKEIVLIGFLIAVSFIFIASPFNYLVLAGFILYAFIENIYRIVESNYLQNLAGDKRRASFLSIASFTRQGYSIAIIPLLSVVAVANLAYVFYIFAVFQVFATCAFWYFVKSRS